MSTEELAALKAAVATEATKSDATKPVEATAETEKAPVTPEVIAEADKPAEAATTEETGTEPAEGTEPKKKGGGFQKRIDTLTREKYEAELRAEQYQRELEQVRQKKPAETIEEPKIDSGKYATHEEFLKAHAEYSQKIGEQKGYEKAQQESMQQQHERQAREVQAAIAAREANARQKFTDYDVTIAPYVPILLGNEAIGSYIASEDMGAEMAYHLTKNPALLDEIRKMPTYKASRELLKLEERLSAPPPVKQPTKAPDPVKTVGTQETVKKTLADLAKASDATDYIQRRQKQKLGKT